MTKNHTIAIYQDAGVSPISFAQTLATAQTFFPHDRVCPLDAKAVREGAWVDETALFILPGGADRPYMAKLQGQGNTNIKRYVHAGGAFLGICAGAYYASASIVFDVGGSFEVVEDRELGFFPGRAIGPILAPYHPKNNQGVKAAQLECSFPNLKQATVFYNGGCFFEEAEAYPETHIMARYDNGLPAILGIPYGHGQVVLSSVHFEYNPALLDETDPDLQAVIPVLMAQEASRIALIKECMDFLRLKIGFEIPIR